MVESGLNFSCSLRVRRVRIGCLRCLLVEKSIFMAIANNAVDARISQRWLIIHWIINTGGDMFLLTP